MPSFACNECCASMDVLLLIRLGAGFPYHSYKHVLPLPLVRETPLPVSCPGELTG